MDSPRQQYYNMDTPIPEIVTNPDDGLFIQGFEALSEMDTDMPLDGIPDIDEYHEGEEMGLVVPYHGFRDDFELGMTEEEVKSIPIVRGGGLSDKYGFAQGGILVNKFKNVVGGRFLEDSEPVPKAPSPEISNEKASQANGKPKKKRRIVWMDSVPDVNPTELQLSKAPYDELKGNLVAVKYFDYLTDPVLKISNSGVQPVAPSADAEVEADNLIMPTLAEVGADVEPLPQLASEDYKPSPPASPTLSGSPSSSPKSLQHAEQRMEGQGNVRALLTRTARSEGHFGSMSRSRIAAQGTGEISAFPVTLQPSCAPRVRSNPDIESSSLIHATYRAKPATPAATLLRSTTKPLPPGTPVPQLTSFSTNASDASHSDIPIPRLVRMDDLTVPFRPAAAGIIEPPVWYDPSALPPTLENNPAADAVLAQFPDTESVKLRGLFLLNKTGAPIPESDIELFNKFKQLITEKQKVYMETIADENRIRYNSPTNMPELPRRFGRGGYFSPAGGIRPMVNMAPHAGPSSHMAPTGPVTSGVPTLNGRPLIRGIGAPVPAMIRPTINPMEIRPTMQSPGYNTPAKTAPPASVPPYGTASSAASTAANATRPSTTSAAPKLSGLGTSASSILGKLNLSKLSGLGTSPSSFTTSSASVSGASTSAPPPTGMDSLGAASTPASNSGLPNPPPTTAAPAFRPGLASSILGNLSRSGLAKAESMGNAPPSVPALSAAPSSGSQSTMSTLPSHQAYQPPPHHDFFATQPPGMHSGPIYPPNMTYASYNADIKEYLRQKYPDAVNGIVPTTGSIMGLSSRPCAFFTSRPGCKGGASCKFIHDINYEASMEEFHRITGDRAYGRRYGMDFGQPPVGSPIGGPMNAPMSGPMGGYPGGPVGGGVPGNYHYTN